MNKIELIDRAERLEEVEAVLRNEGRYAALMHIKNLIMYAPTIDAAPVRRGEWVFVFESVRPFETVIEERCSLCGRYVQRYGTQSQDNYCPNCGADMRMVDDEQD